MNAEQYLERIENKRLNSTPLYSREEMIDFAEKYAKQLTIPVVSNSVICDDWIHEERVKQNDDTYCPICGKQLQSK